MHPDKRGQSKEGNLERVVSWDPRKEEKIHCAQVLERSGRMGAGDIGVASGADLELQVRSGLVCHSPSVTKVV